MCRQLLDPGPDSLQRHAQSLCAVLEPAAEIITFLPHFLECGVVARTIFPIKFVDRKNVMAVKAATIQFPQAEHASGAPVTVGKWVDRFKLMMHDSRAYDRRNPRRMYVPPLQQFRHHRLHL